MELYEKSVLEYDVDDDGNITIASVLTEVTVTVAIVEKDEPAADNVFVDWEEHRAPRKSATRIEVKAILGTGDSNPLHR